MPSARPEWTFEPHTTPDGTPCALVRAPGDPPGFAHLVSLDEIRRAVHGTNKRWRPGILTCGQTPADGDRPATRGWDLGPFDPRTLARVLRRLERP